MALNREQVRSAHAQLPGSAVAVEEVDLGHPSELLLQRLQLLGTPDEIQASVGLGALFRGPSQSVAVIEAGATALAKWWAAGLGAAAAAAWPIVSAFWSGESEASQRVLIIGLAVAVSAAVLAIGYIVGSDVRGRSAGAVATIEARAKIADTVARLSKELYSAAAPGPAEQLLAMPAALPARNSGREAADEDGWKAIAMKRSGERIEYLLVKGAKQDWVPDDSVQFG